MTYKNKEIEVPTLEMFKEYIALKGFNLNAEDIYLHYRKRDWLTKKNKPAKTLEALVNAWNGVALLKNKKAESREKVKKARLKQKEQDPLFGTSKKKRLKKETKKKEKYKPIPYKKQLKDARCKEFREKVFKHKGEVCENCGSTTFLQVHHIRYKKRHYAWEYKVKDMQVLCGRCHQMVHGLNTELDKQLDLTLKLN